MKVSNYLKLVENDVVVTIADNNYYYDFDFYKIESPDEKDIILMQLFDKLKVTSIKQNCICVNLSDLISKNIDKIKDADLFDNYDIDDIFYNLLNLGNYKINWLQSFVNCLTK